MTGLKIHRMYYWLLTCQACGKKFRRARPHAKTCSQRCRQAKKRGGIFLFDKPGKLKWIKG